MDKRSNEGKRRVPGANAHRPQEKAPHIKPRKHAPQPPQTREDPSPEVVYLPPKPFSRTRMILQLASVAAVVLALMLGLSVFFKVEHIEVSGCQKYTAWDVAQASGIEVGDRLLTFSVPRAAALIEDELQYVARVRIRVRLPDTVQIEVTEVQVGYALADESGAWWLLSSEGRVLERCVDPSAHTRVLGVRIQTPTVGQTAAALEEATAGDTPVTVTASRRLSVALELTGALERCGILGKMQSLNVENLFAIEGQYADTFRVLFGQSDALSTKARYLKGFTDEYSQNRPYERGTLDLSDLSRIEYTTDAVEKE